MQLYTSCCETVLALQPGPACVHRSTVHNHRGIPWQKVSFTKYLILHSFEVTLVFTPLFRTAGSPPPGLSMEIVGQWGEQRRLLMENSDIRTAHPSTALSEWQREQVTEDLLRPCVKEQWLCYHQDRAQTQIVTRSLTQRLGVLFSSCFQGAGAQKHIFILPVPSEEVLGATGGIPTIALVDTSLDLHWR